MIDFITYSIKSNCVALVLYLFYYVLLRNNTFYTHKRIYFIVSILLIFLTPLLNLSALFAVPAPLTQLTIDIPQITQELTAGNGALNMAQYIGILLLTGTAVLLIRFAVQFISLFLLLRNSSTQQINGQKIRCADDISSPFSFFNFIVLNPKLYSTADLQQIITHEQAHAKQVHCIDIIACELMTTILWYNPLIWLFRAACKQNIEFLADEQAVQSGCNKQHYQYALLRISKQPVNYQLVNNFTFSYLKNRIVMLNRPRSSQRTLFKFVLLVPVIVSTVWVVNAHQQTIESSNLFAGLLTNTPSEWLKDNEAQAIIRQAAHNHIIESHTIQNALKDDNQAKANPGQSLSILPQPAFDKTEYSFGTINETDGLVSCYFAFVNVGGSPLIISNVKASCTCTTPEWSKAPIPPGGVGYVKATYNPVNRVHPFYRLLTVVYNGSPSTQTLRITGNVVK